MITEDVVKAAASNEENRLEIMALLLATNKVDVDSKDNYYCTKDCV
jgi:hypothetical protein